MSNKKDELIKCIVDYYTMSKGLNGLPLSKLDNVDEYKNELLNLIDESKIIVTSNNETINPYVKNMNINTPLQTQKNYIINYNIYSSIVLYPTLKVLDNVVMDYKEIYSSVMRRGLPQMKIIFFDTQVVEAYLYNPDFIIKDLGHVGRATLSDEALDRGLEFEEVRRFGISYNKNNHEERAIGVFLGDLSKLPGKAQMYWHKFELKNQDDWIMNTGFIRALVKGQWLEETWTFSDIIKEIKSINDLCVEMGAVDIFRQHELSTLEDYRSILYPTLRNYNSFLLTFDKMLSDSIIKDFFKDNSGVTIMPELKFDDERNKGTLKLLEEWLKLNKLASSDEIRNIIKPMRDVRNLRQKPAHKLEENVYDLTLYKKQNELINDVYKGLRTLRNSLRTHMGRDIVSDSFPTRVY